MSKVKKKLQKCSHYCAILARVVGHSSRARWCWVFHLSSTVLNIARFFSLMSVPIWFQIPGTLCENTFLTPSSLSNPCLRFCLSVPPLVLTVVVLKLNMLLRLNLSILLTVFIRLKHVPVFPSPLQCFQNLEPDFLLPVNLLWFAKDIIFNISCYRQRYFQIIAYTV